METLGRSLYKKTECNFAYTVVVNAKNSGW